jgi:arylsulfatase A-like enzyme
MRAIVLNPNDNVATLIDHNVGRILDALESNGLAENTIVVYTTDHGDLLGDHGLYLKGPTPYEGVLRVGMLFQGPGIPADKVVADPVSTVDLAATFQQLAGLEKPEEMQSESLLPLITDGGSRDVAYSEWNLADTRCGVPLELRTVRTKTHKCTFELISGAGELYDLANDPLEMDNLFDDDGARAVRKELEDMMRARPGSIRNDFADPVGAA